MIAFVSFLMLVSFVQAIPHTLYDSNWASFTNTNACCKDDCSTGCPGSSQFACFASQYSGLESIVKSYLPENDADACYGALGTGYKFRCDGDSCEVAKGSALVKSLPGIPAKDYYVSILATRKSGAAFGSLYFTAGPNAVTSLDGTQKVISIKDAEVNTLVGCTFFEKINLQNNYKIVLFSTTLSGSYDVMSYRLSEVVPNDVETFCDGTTISSSYRNEVCDGQDNDRDGSIDEEICQLNQICENDGQCISGLTCNPSWDQYKRCGYPYGDITLAQWRNTSQTQKTTINLMNDSAIVKLYIDGNNLIDKPIKYDARNTSSLVFSVVKLFTSTSGSNCDVSWAGSRWTGNHNDNKMYSVSGNYYDNRFVCYSGKFYHCSWSNNDSALAKEVTNGQQVGSWQCDQAGSIKWIPGNTGAGARPDMWIPRVGNYTYTATVMGPGSDSIISGILYVVNYTYVAPPTPEQYVCVDNGARVKYGNYYYNTVGYGDDASDACSLTTPECCPSGYECSTSLSDPGCKESVDNQDNLQCDFYQNKDDCLEDDRNLVEEEPLYDSNNCDDRNDIECFCNWVNNSGEESCTFGWDDITDGSVDYDAPSCSYISNEGECTDGQKSIQYSAVPLTCPAQQAITIPCGRPVLQLPFFGMFNLIASLLAIATIYSIMFRKSKK